MNTPHSDLKLAPAECSGCRFRIPRDSGRALWQITNRCNYRCGYCIFGSGDECSGPELSLETIRRVLFELKAQNFRYIKFTGGEPFIRPDLIPVLDYAAELGLSADVSSNAALITAETARRLKPIGLSMVHVGLDGHTAVVSEAARGTGTFEASLRGLRNLLDAGVPVRIGCVIFRQNEYSLKEMVKFSAGLGAAELVFSMMVPLGRLKGDLSNAAQRDQAALSGEIESLAMEYANQIKVSANFGDGAGQTCGAVCPGGTRFLYIDHTGYISPCTWVAEESSRFRSSRTLAEAPLEELLQSEPLRAYQKRIRSLPCGCPMER